MTMEFGDRRVTGSNETETVPYEEFVRETPKSYMIRFSSTQTLFVPKSIAEIDQDDKEVYMPRWYYEEHFI